LGVYTIGKGYMTADEVQGLYEQYGFVIYGRCLRILHDEEDARDAMQSVFLKLLEHCGRIRDRKSVVAWVYSTATNHCFNVRRGRKGREVIDADTVAGADPNERMEARSVVRLLLHIADRRVRDAAYYTFVEELDQKEIGAVTGQSPATIRRNLARFKEHVASVRRRLGI
jgi:RNA polymerase sigma-70 factor (ECF subfamily)